MLISDKDGLASWLDATNLNDNDWEIIGLDIARREGNVIIGDGLSTPDGYKLYVADGILTEEVKVAIKTTTDWSDYVFESDYSLTELRELDKYIKEHKKLPGASAQEVVNDGIRLGEMNALLLKKIEELTLYIIEQDKRITTLESSKELNY